MRQGVCPKVHRGWCVRHARQQDVRIARREVVYRHLHYVLVYQVGKFFRLSLLLSGHLLNGHLLNGQVYRCDPKHLLVRRRQCGEYVLVVPFAVVYHLDPVG